jgi:hypothetical protein
MRSFITYLSLVIIRVIKSRRFRWVGHVARWGRMRNAFKIVVGKPERKRPLGRPKLRGEDNIRMVSREVEWEDVDWMHLAQGRNQRWDIVNTVMNFRVPKKGG